MAMVNILLTPIGSGDYTDLFSVWELDNTQMYQKPHILGSKNNWGLQFKMVYEICEEICFSFYAKEFNVIVHETSFLCISLFNFRPFCTQNH